MRQRPAGLCQEFARQGFAVARYDQRDAGQSTRLPDTSGHNPFAAVARRRSAYSSEDMTDDAVAVLDALGWNGRQIGLFAGLIAQRIALRHPDRVLSVVSASAVPSDRPGQVATTLVPACWPGSPAPGSPKAGTATSSSRSCSPARSLRPPTPSTRTPPGSGSNARLTAVPAIPRRKAGRQAPGGTALSYASCGSPCSSCTATATPSCVLAPPAPPRKRLTAPAWLSSRVSVTIFPLRCGQPSRKRSANSPTRHLRRRKARPRRSGSRRGW